MNQERRHEIVNLITQKRTVKNTELMERFGISIETVRRDLEYLEHQGYLRRVYGGAVLQSSLGSEPEYTSRVKNHFEEKNAIAAAAAKLISPGDSVYLGVGTTIQAMVQHLKNMSDITVFTNSLRTAMALSDSPGCAVVLPGGELRAKELSLTGFPAEENLAQFNVDKAFIGTGGVTESGITDFHIGEARLHRQMIHSARQSIALADSSKFGLRTMTNLCSLEDIDLLVTDDKAPKKLIKALEQAGIQVVVADVLGE